MNLLECIRRKRDGKILSAQEMKSLILAFTKGEMPDYQMSALLMAIFFRGLENSELTAMVDVMLHSGDSLSFDPQLNAVDKHSTGGVGDKTSIPLIAAVAACGATVPMIAGRGLGHTGGTIDKLEAIPGFKTSMNLADFKKQVETIGCGIMGQNGELAPADKVLYALRDASGTVESLPLIAASIMSKKLAEGISSLVLDVKFGSGAFMVEKEKARLLAQTMVDIGASMGTKMTAFLTSMEQPLGKMIGNALEINECLDVLQDKGPSDLKEHTIVLGGEMLALSGHAKNLEDGKARVQNSLSTGKALEQFYKMCDAQGADTASIRENARLPVASHQHIMRSEKNGYFSQVDNYQLGLSATCMGAGRQKLSDVIDPGVGIEMHVRLGDEVRTGDALCTFFENKANLKNPVHRTYAESAFVISEEAPAPFSLFDIEIRS